MVEDQGVVESLLEQTWRFHPPDAFKQRAAVHMSAVYEEARRDPEGFWARFAQELHWFRPWDKVLEWNPPYAQWFVGGKTNLSYNCLDRHLTTWRRNKVAFVWEGESEGERVLTYEGLHREVCRFANALKGLGVKKGDRVALYMPMILELPIAMLACSRIGAIHNVVFGGFSANALQERINDSQAKVVITADGGYRRGNIVPLKASTDEALQDAPTVEKVIVVRRIGEGMTVSMTPRRDLWWHDIVADVPVQCDAEPVDAEDMLYILYTSGTTGKPKGIVHTTGGYMVGVYATTIWVFDIKDEDMFWCTADIGWVTGHSYVVYGPLLNGASSLMYEGAPDYPDRDRFWALVEKHRVNVFYTSPTAIRSCMRWGEEYPKRHDLSSLRLLGTVGEPINPRAWLWYRENIGESRLPVVDTWWQTETGMILISPLPGLTTLKPGSATFPFPTVEAEVVDEAGNPVQPGQKGLLLLTRPWPAMLRTLYKDDERYVSNYWSRFPGKYLTGDHAMQDEEGYFWLLGRSDDVINVAGHRLSTMEVESALVDHPAVAEVAAIGKSHEIKGQAITTFVMLKEEVTASPELEAELKQHVVEKISPIARPDDMIFVAELPKTRSGKIMRRLLKDVAEGRAMGDTTTLADPSVMGTLKEQYEETEG